MIGKVTEFKAVFLRQTSPAKDEQLTASKKL